MKTLTKFTIPVILLFLSGCAHHGYHSGHYSSSSYGYTADRHNNYQPHTVYYDRQIKVHKPAIHKYYSHEKHYDKRHHKYNGSHAYHYGKRHNKYNDSHAYHYNKHDDNSRHYKDKRHHKKHRKETGRYGEKHTANKALLKHDYRHRNAYAYRPDKHYNKDFHRKNQKSNKYKQRKKHNDGRHYTDRSISKSRTRHEKHSNKAGSRNLAKQQGRTWHSVGKRSRHNDSRH